MILEYIYRIDEDETLHGFDIEIDDEDFVKIETLKGFNDYANMSNIKTLGDLKAFLCSHIDEVDDLVYAKNFPKDFPTLAFTNTEIFEELIDFIDRTMCIDASKKD